jgi:hypothetical protein
LALSFPWNSRQWRVSSISCICLAGMLSLAAGAFLAAGQQGVSPVSRTIEGKVLDHNGNIVPGAVVLIKDLKSLQVRSYIVQQDGKYHFHGLSADANYQLRAQANGLLSGAKTVSVFESHPTVEVNLKLAAKQLK